MPDQSRRPLIGTLGLAPDLEDRLRARWRVRHLDAESDLQGAARGCEALALGPERGLPAGLMQHLAEPELDALKLVWATAPELLDADEARTFGVMLCADQPVEQALDQAFDEARVPDGCLNYRKG